MQVDHRIVSYLPEKEAHNAVYRAFNDADESWIRAKIDADVVLSDDQVLLRVAQRLVELPMAHGLDPLVLDYMTDRELHAGAFFYTHHVAFSEQHDHLLCDRGMIYHPDSHWFGDIGVIGRHMHHCNELTAFRYGFHRGLKRQATVFEKVKSAYEKHKDPLRLLAIKGFEAGLVSERDVGHNYGDERLMLLFKSVNRSN